MKKKDKWISIAIISICFLMLYNSSQQKGFIKIDAGGANAKLHLKGSWFNNTMISSDSQSHQVHSAIHRSRYLSISKTQDDHTWQIISSGPWGDLSKIKVRKNQTVSLRLGPPFIIKPKAHRSGNTYLIEFDILGQAGEQYQKYATRDDRRLSSAKLRIVDEQENVLHTGQFQYG